MIVMLAAPSATMLLKSWLPAIAYEADTRKFRIRPSGSMYCALAPIGAFLTDQKTAVPEPPL
ncbi:hypothetical protein D3C83_238630 [compost metagenome]